MTQETQEPEDRHSTSSMLLISAVVIAALFALIFMIFRPAGEDDSAAAPTSRVTVTATPETVTETSTTTRTATAEPSPTRASRTTTEQAAPAYEEPQQEQWPSPPAGQLGQGMEWAPKGPFGTQSTCEQNADYQPSRVSTCFPMSDGYYYFFARQAR